MSGLSAYLLRVICGALVCALVDGICRSSGLRRLTAGVFMMLTLLGPLGDFSLTELDLDHIRTEAQAAVRTGTGQMKKAQDAIITQSLEAYIWNKAADLGLQLQVCVTLDTQGLPQTVELTGTASPSDRQMLSAWIVRELGLGKEALVWISPHQSNE